MYYPKGVSAQRAFKERYSYTATIKEAASGLSRRDRRWLEMACRLAGRSKERTKHGCVITNGGAFQASAVNTRRNQPGIIEEIDCLSVHAEINALRKAKRTQGATVYIARVNNAGEKRQSRPCPECLAALKAAGVKRICYTINGEEYL